MKINKNLTPWRGDDIKALLTRLGYPLMSVINITTSNGCDLVIFARPRTLKRGRNGGRGYYQTTISVQVPKNQIDAVIERSVTGEFVWFLNKKNPVILRKRKGAV